MASPIVIYVPTRPLFAVKTKGLLFLKLEHLNKKSNVCKQNLSTTYIIIIIIIIINDEMVYEMNLINNKILIIILLIIFNININN